MTRTTNDVATPWAPAIGRPEAMRLAATEYQRVLDTLRSLPPGAWSARTECPEWDVRDIAAHLLGMVEMAASLREQRRQTKAARRSAGPFIDELTALQVEERAGMTSADLMERFTARWPKAVSGRRRTPGFVRRRPLSIPQTVGGREEIWTIGFLVDVILTRDPWMHRVDIARATGTPHLVTADHDGVLVADMVAEWAARHGQPYSLRLTGPAGGTWHSGPGGEVIELDAVEFCRIVSGRRPAEGLLTTQVPF